MEDKESDVHPHLDLKLPKYTAAELYQLFMENKISNETMMELLIKLKVISSCFTLIF